MAKKATLTPVTDTALNAGAINTQLNAINDQLDNTLSLDGSTPNAMNADVDLNSNDILNGGNIHATEVLLGGIPLSTTVAASSASAAASAVASAASAVSAAASEAASLVNVTTTQNLYSGDDSTVNFTLPYEPVGVNGIMVYVDGVHQSSNSVSTSGTTLVFAEAPPTGTDNIVVRMVATGTTNFTTYTNLVVKKEYTTVTLLLADTADGTYFTTGDYVTVVEGGFAYKVVTSGDITNAGSIQFEVLPNADGSYTLEAFGDTTVTNAQTVFAAAASAVAQGVIRCNSLAYTTTTTISIPSNIQFVGLGAGSSGSPSSIQYSGSTKAVVYESVVSGTPVRWGGISGFTITNTAASTDVLYVKGGWNGIFNNLTLVGNSSADYCLRLQAATNFGTYYNTFTHVEGISGNVANLDVDGDTDSTASRANSNKFFSCRFDSGAGVGVRLAGCDVIDFYGQNIEGNAGTGLAVGVAARSAPTRVSFFGGYIENLSATYDVDATLASTGGNGGVNFYSTRMSSAKVRSGSICQFFGGQDNGKYTPAASTVMEQFTIAGEAQPSMERDGRGRLSYEITGTAAKVLTAKSVGDTNDRIEIINSGEIRAGSGSLATDIGLKRRGSANPHWQDETSRSVVVSSRTTGGAGSAGAGNQYVEVTIDGTVYKLLHD